VTNDTGVRCTAKKPLEKDLCQPFNIYGGANRSCLYMMKGVMGNGVELSMSEPGNRSANKPGFWYSCIILYVCPPYKETGNVVLSQNWGLWYTFTVSNL
jgi:hypothetical protein